MLLRCGDYGLDIRVTKYPKMASHKVPLSDNPYDERRQGVTPALSHCPICNGKMEVIYSRHSQQVIVCIDCHSGLTVPANAWDVVRIKRQTKWMPDL